MGKAHLSVGEDAEPVSPVVAGLGGVGCGWEERALQYFSHFLHAFAFLLPSLSVAEKCGDVNSVLLAVRCSVSSGCLHCYWL